MRFVELDYLTCLHALRHTLRGSLTCHDVDSQWLLAVWCCYVGQAMVESGQVWTEIIDAALSAGKVQQVRLANRERCNGLRACLPLIC